MIENDKQVALTMQWIEAFTLALESTHEQLDTPLRKIQRKKR